MFWVGFAVGLITGWNFLKQPEWVAEKVTKIKNKIAAKLW